MRGEKDKHVQTCLTAHEATPLEGEEHLAWLRALSQVHHYPMTPTHTHTQTHTFAVLFPSFGSSGRRLNLVCSFLPHLCWELSILVISDMTAPECVGRWPQAGGCTVMRTGAWLDQRILKDAVLLMKFLIYLMKEKKPLRNHILLSNLRT